MAQLNGVSSRINLKTSKATVKAKKSGMPTAATKRYLATVTMGVWMPLMSLILSYVGGRLLSSELFVLAGLSFLLMACVLLVSLTHLAAAIADITKSHWLASWLLAIAFDASLVLAELCHVQAEKAEIGGVVTCLMVAVCGLSMFLNCWAFLSHKRSEKTEKTNN